MKLSLSEAATVLGKSQRQVRYLISQKRLKAAKEGGRWRIESADLPLTEPQREALSERLGKARQAFEKGLEPAAKSVADEPDRRHFSVRDLGAFQKGEAIYREASPPLGQDDPGCQHLLRALTLLTRGCHTFHPAEKASRFLEAREAAATAVAVLFLATDPDNELRRKVAERIEQELIPKLTGLIAMHEKRSRRSRFDRFAASSRPGS